MFGPKHYVPVLRAKPAELRALRELAPALRQWTTPLLECPVRVVKGCESPRTLEARFDTLVGPRDVRAPPGTARGRPRLNCYWPVARSIFRTAPALATCTCGGGW